MEDKKMIGIRFGALAPTIAQQLRSQKFKYDTEKAKHFETLRTSITYLMFGDILNDSGVKKAEQKLFSKIKQHVKQKNKL